MSPSARQALRAALYLAIHVGQGPVSTRQIAQAESIPAPFLAKLLHSLRLAGIIRSMRGPGGGHELQRSPGRIRVSEIIQVFDGKEALEKKCLLGLNQCNDTFPCALHDRWKVFRENYVKTITSLSLSQAAESLVKRGGH